YHEGGFVNASLDKASVDNERNALHLRTPAGVDITCVQIAGLIARRILCYVNTGDRLTRGQRYGFIRFGSRLDVHLPPNAKPRASVGDVVYATESILAELNQRPAFVPRIGSCYACPPSTTLRPSDSFSR